MHSGATPAETSGHRSQSSSVSGDGIADIIGILDTVDVPIVVVRRDCRIVRFNRAASEVLALTPADIGRLACNVRALADVKDLEKLCSQVFADQAPARCDVRNGDRWFILRMAPCPGLDQQSACAVLTFTNVTGFRASIAQAIYDREYTKAIFNTMKEPVVVLDAGLRVQTANRAFYEMFGASREAAQSVPLSQLGEDGWKRCSLWPALEATLAENAEFKTIEIECDFRAGRRTVLLEASRFSQNGSTSLVLVFHDITARKRAQEALLRQEAQLQTELADTKLLQGISAEIIHHDHVETLYDKIMDAAVTIMRSDYASMQMLYPERGAGGELRLLAFRGFNPRAAKFWEWVRADSESTCGAALRTGRRAIASDVEKCDYMAGTQDLATYLQTGIHAVQTTPLFSRSGKMVGMLSTHWRKPHEPSERDLRLLDILARQAADLIERKQAEDALREAHRQLADRAGQLEQLVAERTAKLRETISELESFSYSITHDMRAPLRAMQSFSKILNDEFSAQLPREGQDYLRRIGASARRMDQLITDVLNYSRVVQGDFPLCPVDLARLLREILESYPSFQPPHVTISTEEKPPPVFGNEAALTQCISNLLGNAVKFVAQGVQPHVRVSFTQDDSHVHLSFQDNGIGIEPEAQERIFELFQRNTREFEGTGVGLAIVKKAVERMGGSVTLTSQPGQGSTFCLHLRRADRK